MSIDANLVPFISQCLIWCTQWPRGLRRRSAAERLLVPWVRIPAEAWMFVLYSVCVVR
jgi:hypothetical protein